MKRDYAKSFPDSEVTPDWLPYSLPFAAMRKKAWEEQPFYTDAWASEDTHWGVKAKERGWKIKYVKDAIVMHSHNYTLKQLYGRKFVEGEADAWIYSSAASFLTCLSGFIKGSIRELLQTSKQADLKGFLKAVPRQWVGHKAHHQGLKLGIQRLKAGDKDSSKGQAVIAEFYDDGING